MKKKVQNGDTIATQHDLALLWGKFSTCIDGVELRLAARLDTVEEELVRHRNILKFILSVVQSIAGRFQERSGDHVQIRNHEDRITAAEIQIRTLQK